MGTGSRRRAGTTTASSTSAARAARATFPAATCWRSTRRPARCSGTSTPFRRTRRIRAGTIAGPTWVGGERNGGGIWETPSIDPELGMIYVAVGNPFGDSTKRAGTNLFTDSIIALTLDTGTSEVALPADAPRRVGLRLGQSADPVRHAGARTARQGGRRGEQERLPVHPRSRNGRAGAPDQGDAVPTDNPAAGTRAVADAADSVHGGREADGTGVADRARPTLPPSSSPRTSQRADVQPAAAATGSRAGHGRRRELRSAVVQPAHRTALRQRHRSARSTRARARRATSPRTIRQPAS